MLVQSCAAAGWEFFAKVTNPCVLKLRQFGEALAQHIARVLGVNAFPETRQPRLTAPRAIGQSVPWRISLANPNDESAKALLARFSRRKAVAATT